MAQNQVLIYYFSTLILDKNIKRDFFLIRNISDNNVYVYFGDEAVVSKGMLLEKGDSIYGDNYIGTITGIVLSGTGTVAYIEIEKVTPEEKICPYNAIASIRK